MRGRPPELSFVHSEELFDTIKKQASLVDFDIVQIEHGRMDLYLEALPPTSQSKSVLMFHNFTYQQYGRVSRVERNLIRKLRSFLNSYTMLKWEPSYAQRFTCSTTVSELDKKLLLDANPHLRVEVIPNGVDIKKYQPLPMEDLSPSMMFIGNMGYPPSADAMLFFCRDILPLIRRTIPDVELWIVGRDAPPDVLNLADENTHVTGRVEDVIPYYQRSSICIVPLRAGGGTRLKILESMALGRPVVSTTIGCEGLDVVDGQHLLVADDAEQFAEKTVRLLTDQQLHRTLSAYGRRLVETSYDWDVIAKQLMDVFADILAIPNHPEAARKG
jgi:glycosyltransferase involved in cell wall biosynthesis